MPLIFNAKLSYLESHEHMGVARVSCHGGCSCETHQLDGHTGGTVAGVSNTSAWAVDVFTLHGASRDCKIRLEVLDLTSSGEHKFKVNGLIIVHNA